MQKRRAQFREAQQRARQKKNNALSDANEKAEELRAILDKTNKALEEFQQGCDDEARIKLFRTLAKHNVLPHTPWSQQAEYCKTPDNGQSGAIAFEESTSPIVDGENAVASWELEDYLDNFQEHVPLDFELPNGIVDGVPANSEDLEYFSTGDLETQARRTRGLEPVLGFDELDQNGSPLKMSTNTNDAANGVQPALPYPSTMELKSLAHRETSFSRYLYRRSWETIYHMLSNPSTDQRWINRVFGNTFGYLTPSYVLSMVSRLLSTNDHEALEFFHYPEFQSPRTDMAGQERHSSVQSYLRPKSFDAQAEDRNIRAREDDGDRLLTPMDIERFCVNHGMLSQFANYVAQPFWHSGMLWELDLEKFISGEWVVLFRFWIVVLMVRRLVGHWNMRGSSSELSNLGNDANAFCQYETSVNDQQLGIIPSKDPKGCGFIPAAFEGMACALNDVESTKPLRPLPLQLR